MAEQKLLGAHAPRQSQFTTLTWRKSEASLGAVGLQSLSILVASALVQGGIATNAVDRPLRYNQRRSWLPIIVFGTKSMGFFLVVRSP